MRDYSTATEDNGRHEGGGASGGGGGGGTGVDLSDLQAAVGAAMEALNRALASGVGVAMAMTALAAAKWRLADRSGAPTEGGGKIDGGQKGKTQRRKKRRKRREFPTCGMSGR